MTLMVSTFWDDPETGKMACHPDWEDGHYMAGFEDYRWMLWGSEPVKRRGATFLPQLAVTNLHLWPDEVERFLVEVRGLLADVDGLVGDLGWGADVRLLRHYLHNFIRAAELARTMSGGVLID